MLQLEVLDICRRVGPKYEFDPVLLLALCEQESAYDESAMRLEQGFYRRYVRKMILASTVKALFSTSWGLTQCMGAVLHEMDYFSDMSTPEAIAKALNLYMISPDLQVEYGARHLRERMIRQGTTDISVGLRLYNGSSEYPPKVLARFNRMKEEGLR